MMTEMRSLHLEHHEQLSPEQALSAALTATPASATQPAAAAAAAAAKGTGSNAVAQAKLKDPKFVEALLAVKRKAHV